MILYGSRYDHETSYRPPRRQPRRCRPPRSEMGLGDQCREILLALGYQNDNGVPAFVVADGPQRILSQLSTNGVGAHMDLCAAAAYIVNLCFGFREFDPSTYLARNTTGLVLLSGHCALEFF